MGKTSLLARGLHEARARGSTVALTDFQTISLPVLADPDKLLLALAASLVDQLDLEVEPSKAWNPDLGANANFDRFMGRNVLANLDGHLVWALDEIDRLFPPACTFGNEIFALLRSWHNRRSLDPLGRWSQLTLAIAYATEAHLFIDDLNQSPFNVGVRLTLDDFDLRQLSDLNGRYGRPLDDPTAVRRFHALSGGHPYLVRRGLDEMRRRKLTIDEMEKEADRDEGCFGDHLRRLQATLAQDDELADAVRGLVRGQPTLTSRNFYRLRSVGVISGGSAADAQFRCRLYSAYLARNLD